MFNLSLMSKDELRQQLYKELSFYEKFELDKISKILVDQIPRKYIMRVISKLYRLRSKEHA